MIITHGGTFKAIQYQASQPLQQGSNVRVGCRMYLEFKAHQFVTCARYGLLQMVDYQDMGQPAYPPGWPDTQQRAGNAGQFIDKKQGFVNPMSNASNPPSVFSAQDYAAFLQALPDDEARGVVQRMSQPDGGGGLLVHLNFSAAERTRVGNPAIDELARRMRAGGGLGDAPSRQVTDSWGAPPNTPTRYLDMPNHPMAAATFQQGTVTSSRKFETAAICVEGPGAGTYLGSVEWGFYTQGGQIHLYPFRAVAMGAPSAAFKAAVQGWNAAGVTVGSGQVAPIPIPLNDAASVPAMPTTRDELGDRFGAVRHEFNQLVNPVGAGQINRLGNLRLELTALVAQILVEARPVAQTKQVAYQGGESLRTFAGRATGRRGDWIEIFKLNSFTISSNPNDGDLLIVPDD